MWCMLETLSDREVKYIQWIVYTYSTFLSLFTAQVVNTVQTTQFNIQYSNMCLLDSRNLCHIVIAGLKRKYLHWWGNLLCIGTKPTVPYFLHRWMVNKTWESQVISAWNWNIACVCVQSSHYASFNSSNYLATEIIEWFKLLLARH